MTTRTITAYEHTCMRCGFTWGTFLEHPVTCKKCKSKEWMTPATKGRGRPRTLPDELSEDRRRYHREYARKRRAKPSPVTKINPART